MHTWDPGFCLQHYKRKKSLKSPQASIPHLDQMVVQIKLEVADVVADVADVAVSSGQQYEQ